MAEPLKLFFDRALVGRIAKSLHDAWPSFDAEAFTRDAVKGLGPLELMARAEHIAGAMGRHLPPSFPKAAAIVVRSLGEKHASDELVGAGMTPFFYLPHTMFVATRGLDDVEVALDAQHELTQRFSCEFSIRAFLAKHPDETFERMAAWVTDPSPHVRRLVSEGTRPRLPWGARVKILDDNPARALALLEHLKDDPSSLVRRSVANHLNDLSKGHSELFYETCAAWLHEATPERHALVEHALRSALKRAEPRALALIGAGAAPAVDLVSASCAPRRVAIGEKVRVRATVRSTAKRAQHLHVDLEVVFVKARGASPKVFKLKRVDVPPGEEVTFDKLVSLAVHTTRTPRPGRHRLALLVNGARLDLGHFDVVDR